MLGSSSPGAWGLSGTPHRPASAEAMLSRYPYISPHLPDGGSGAAHTLLLSSSDHIPGRRGGAEASQTTPNSGVRIIRAIYIDALECGDSEEGAPRPRTPHRRTRSLIVRVVPHVYVYLSSPGFGRGDAEGLSLVLTPIFSDGGFRGAWLSLPPRDPHKIMRRVFLGLRPS